VGDAVVSVVAGAGIGAVTAVVGVSAAVVDGAVAGCVEVASPVAVESEPSPESTTGSFGLVADVWSTAAVSSFPGSGGA
jgi:hypothetical protein